MPNRRVPNKFPQKRTKWAQVVPPPHQTYVDHRAKHQKTPISNSPKKILFVNQRKTIKFPQNKFLHLVTLFLVDSRELPFSESSFGTLIPKNLSNPEQKAQNSPISHGPIIKGLRADSY
jgi:hypothetical protein